MATLKGKRAGQPIVSRKVLASLELEDHDILALVKRLNSGLPFSKLAGFASKTGLTFADVSRVLRIPPRTLARRKRQGALTQLESERLLRLAGLFDKTVELFEGNKVAALNWLRAPAKALAH
ncbi:MAG: hypothetical protein HY040_26455 [Planctomycetes bacterium]|nr:hypothetical protein [Planctomycetota bacterium]